MSAARIILLEVLCTRLKEQSLGSAVVVGHAEEALLGWFGAGVYE